MIKWGRLRWFLHFERKDDGDWVKQCMSIEIAGTRWGGCLSKTCYDCLKDDVKSLGLCRENAQDKED